MTRTEWVDNAAALAEATSGWSGRAIGFDSEFIRVRTFYPEAALYQAADGERVHLMDPLPLSHDELQPLATALSSEQTLFVMHACSEDLELLRYHLGVVPARLFDTQMAMALVSPDASLGYQALVRALLGVEVDKSETRSDWQQRPLSAAQFEYAAIDVVHLQPIHAMLGDKLARLGRTDWMAEEMRNVLAAAATTRRPEDYYQSVRDAWRLEGAELAVFRALCSWRETTAQQRNRPRSRIIPDPVLMEMVREHLHRRRDLEGLLRPPLSEKWAPELEQVIGAALHLDASQWPEPVPAPLTPELSEIIKVMRSSVVLLAAQLAIAESVLASRRLLESLVRSCMNGGGVLPLEWRGWRRTVALPALLPIILQPRWRLTAPQ